MELKLSDGQVNRLLLRFGIKHKLDASPYEKRQLLLKSFPDLPQRDKLVFIRKNEGITQQELADRFGVDMLTISNYERGAFETREKTLENINAFIVKRSE